jgi:serine/threonine protein kinase
MSDPSLPPNDPYLGSWVTQEPLFGSHSHEQKRRRYHLTRRLGQGGFATVYEARESGKRHRVALKMIHLDGLTPQQIIEATDGFHREIALLSHLHHAHLPQISHHFQDAHHWYLVMDLVEGATLEDYLRDPEDASDKTRILPLEEVVDIAKQLCDVLGYLHTRRPAIIFRDLKPGNIMRGKDGVLCLIDFGIARRFKPGQRHDTIPLGSPGYAAPEQYGKAQTTARSDIYSLGVLLYQLLSGNDPSVSPFQFAPLPPECGAFGELVMQMLELDPQKRPGSITTITRRMREIASEKEVEQQQVQNPSAPSWPRHDSPLSPPSILSQQGQPAIPMSPAALRSRWRKGLLSIPLAVLIILIGGASLLLTHAPNRPIPTHHATPTAHAPAAARPFYPPGGKLLLSDPMRESGSAFEWETGYQDGNQCIFRDHAYHVLGICDVEGIRSGHLLFPPKFAFEIHLSAGYNTGSLDLDFQPPSFPVSIDVDPNGEYDMRSGRVEVSGRAAVMQTSPNQPNSIAIVADGTSVTLYLNATRVARLPVALFDKATPISDTSTDLMYLSIAGFDGGNRAEVTYSDARLWSL